MKEKKSFYVGWQDEMSKTQSNFLKKILIPTFLLLPVLGLIIVWAQKPFNGHIFKLGSLTEHTGIYHAEPVPILEVSSKSLPEGISNYILLVGYGKHGVEGIIKNIEKKTEVLDKRQITLKGSLIYGDGKAVLELTEKENSLLHVSDELGSDREHFSTTKEFSEHGEILDPKCYFGVMKPGEGKIHKSCAIRCISGGIPPVFRVQNESKNDYYILLGANGKKINQHILDKIGEEVIITGTSTHHEGWNVLHADPLYIE